MNGSPIILTAILSFAVVCRAEETDFISSEPTAVKDEKSFSSSFDVRAYSGSDLDGLVSPGPESDEQPKGLVLDYYPFESGFRVSAGAFSGEAKKLGRNYFSGDGRTYVGVGWKRLLDNAKRFKVSVDVGAFLDVQEVGDSVSSNTELTPDTSADAAQRLSGKSQEQPIINFGLEFRF